ncbi:hypothetical protein CDS [Salmonella enterica subsp. enterica serovar Derby]|nr:hypothetical protein CDS [Salmonella enterica subsp. enterica serovar Derby]
MLDGLSPLARGTHWKYSGVPGSGAVYPRWRGEHFASLFDIIYIRGLSPLARGTH